MSVFRFPILNFIHKVVKRELTGRIAAQGMSYTAQVHDDRLDTITLPFNLRLKTLHLVAVEGIGDIATNVYGSHDCGCLALVVERAEVSGRRCKSNSDGAKQHELICLINLNGLSFRGRKKKTICV